jgi:hypothetical protein
MSPTVLIIECQDNDEDPGSEGRFVKHLLNLMEVASHYRRARTKGQFLELLSAVPAETSVVHIATHGRFRESRKGQRPRFVGFWTPDGDDVTIKDIEDARISLAGKLVLSTACYSGQKKPREAFKRTTGCKHYIAPIRGPRFYNAALMSHIFYHKHLQLDRSVKRAFREYEERYRNPHVFCLL